MQGWVQSSCVWFGSVRREIMAKPICLTNGPFELKQINCEAMILKSCEDEGNHLDVFVPILVEDANIVYVAFNVLNYVLANFFHDGLRPIGASDEAHWDMD